MKGSCVCTEYVVADSRQGVVLQFGRVCEVLATPTLTTCNASKHFTSPRTWTDPWERRKRWKRDMRFGTWNVKACIGLVHRYGMLRVWFLFSVFAMVVRLSIKNAGIILIK
jgi:hypothetical protein